MSLSLTAAGAVVKLQVKFFEMLLLWIKVQYLCYMVSLAAFIDRTSPALCFWYTQIHPLIAHAPSRSPPFCLGGVCFSRRAADDICAEIILEMRLVGRMRPYASSSSASTRMLHFSSEPLVPAFFLFSRPSASSDLLACSERISRSGWLN